MNSNTETEETALLRTTEDGGDAEATARLVSLLKAELEAAKEENVFLLNEMKRATRILGRQEPEETWEVNVLRAAAIYAASTIKDLSVELAALRKVIDDSKNAQG